MQYLTPYGKKGLDFQLDQILSKKYAGKVDKMCYNSQHEKFQQNQIKNKG